MNRLISSVALLAILSPHIVAGADKAGGIVPQNAELQELWNQGEFTEGVAVRADGMVFFSDIPKSADGVGRILKFDPLSGQTTVFCSDSKKSNGLFFDKSGRLIACCGANGGAMALCEVTAEGMVRPLVERFEGKRFNSPNDLVIHPNGDIYFSDPRYLGPEPLELNHQSVYRYVPSTGLLSRVTTGAEIEKPNGVHLSPDGKTLYVAETNNGSTGLNPETKPIPGRMTLNSFRIQSDGTLSNKQVLVDFRTVLGVDGMSIDQSGRIYAAVRSPDRFGIVVYSPEGQELAYVKTPSLPTNCCFGVGQAASILYVTAGGGFYRLNLSSRQE